MDEMFGPDRPETDPPESERPELGLPEPEPDQRWPNPHGPHPPEPDHPGPHLTSLPVIFVSVYILVKYEIFIVKVNKNNKSSFPHIKDE